MGQKINSIALRLGGRNSWWISKMPSTNSYKNEHEWLWINKIISGVFKKYNILVSELVLKYNQSNKNTANYPSKLPRRGIPNQWKTLNKLNSLTVQKEPIYPYMPQTVRDTIYIDGLVFNPEIISRNLKSDSSELIELLDMPRKGNLDNWELLIKLLKYSRIQSGRSQLLIKEIIYFLKEVIRMRLGIHVEIELEFVRSPKSNSYILSNLIELGVLENYTPKNLKNNRVLSEKKIIKLISE